MLSLKSDIKNGKDVRLNLRTWQYKFPERMFAKNIV